MPPNAVAPGMAIPNDPALSVNCPNAPLALLDSPLSPEVNPPDSWFIFESKLAFSSMLDPAANELAASFVALETAADADETSCAKGLIDSGILSEFPCHIVYLFLTKCAIILLIGEL
jgi:hypothetical protein